MAKSKSSVTFPTITEAKCRRVLEVVDQGLIDGVGDPEPGKMCVEAAVCFALGEPHGDHPLCVHPRVREAKIVLNDDTAWGDSISRAIGLRRLAIAQLGTAAKTFDVDEFTRLARNLVTKTMLPKKILDFAYGDSVTLEAFEELAKKVEKHGLEALPLVLLMTDDCNQDAKYLGTSLFNGEDWINEVRFIFEAELVDFCEQLVQILVQMKTPGSKFLYLTDQIKPPKKIKKTKTSTKIKPKKKAG